MENNRYSNKQINYHFPKINNYLVVPDRTWYGVKAFKLLILNKKTGSVVIQSKRNEGK